MKREKRKTGPYINLPKDLRIEIIERVERYKKENTHHSTALIICPRSKDHWSGLAYSVVNGIEQIFCSQCGYHFVLMKKDSETIELVDVGRKSKQDADGSSVISIYDRIDVKGKPPIICNRSERKRKKRGL